MKRNQELQYEIKILKEKISSLMIQFEIISEIIVSRFSDVDNICSYLLDKRSKESK